MESEIENGIHTDIPITDYHANKTHVSATGLKIVKRSLKEFHWFQTGRIQQEDKPHFDFGNAFELALFDKSGFDKSVAIQQTEAWKNKALAEKPELKVPKLSAAYKREADSFEILNRGKMYTIPDVGTDSFETIEEMLSSCYQDEMVQRLIENTEYQLSLFWTDKATGLNLKTRPDICQRKKNIVVNVKTCVDGSPKAFSKDLANHEYPLQACLEILGCLATGVMETVDNYFWLVVEKNPPYNATIYEFDQGDMKASMDELEYLCNKVKNAHDANLWPGYSDRSDNKYGILTAVIPAYYHSIF